MTKETELKIYKEMLHLMETEGDIYNCLCYAFIKVKHKVFSGWEGMGIEMKDLPELHKYRFTLYRILKLGFTEYWFPLNQKGHQMRLDLLKKCINKLENERIS